MRGWRIERELKTTDASGRPVTVTTGVTTDANGDDVRGLAITAIGSVSMVGPTAVFGVDDGSRLVANLLLSLADPLEQRGGV
ncbi:hypothetical protein ACFORO_12685 [Amycolatopsis halotolerans]|uniref:Uncharacterized protein n=1 Tax=Amycolatopsis halotolerans TaxID=330083 RepID=A0ABV7QFH4_9PSEU